MGADRSEFIASFPRTRIVAHATKDPTWRSQLVVDTRRALEETFALDVPRDLVIDVREESPERVVLVIPTRGAGTSPEGYPSADLIQRAHSDPAYREQLLRHPRRAIEEHLGLDLPGEVEILIEEETEARLVLVLPPPTAAAEEDLVLSSAMAYTGKKDTKVEGDCPIIIECDPALRTKCEDDDGTICDNTTGGGTDGPTDADPGPTVPTEPNS